MSQASDFLSRLDGDVSSIAKALALMGARSEGAAGKSWTFEDGSVIEIDAAGPRTASRPAFAPILTISERIRLGIWN